MEPSGNFTTITVMREGRPATQAELEAAVLGEALPPVCMVLHCAGPATAELLVAGRWCPVCRAHAAAQYRVRPEAVRGFLDTTTVLVGGTADGADGADSI